MLHLSGSKVMDALKTLTLVLKSQNNPEVRRTHPLGPADVSWKSLKLLFRYFRSPAEQLSDVLQRLAKNNTLPLPLCLVDFSLPFCIAHLLLYNACFFICLLLTCVTNKALLYLILALLLLCNRSLL